MYGFYFVSFTVLPFTVYRVAVYRLRTIYYHVQRLCLILRFMF